MCRRIRSGAPLARSLLSGCGQHVEQVLAGVPHAQRCGLRAGGTTGRFNVDGCHVSLLVTARSSAQLSAWVEPLS